MGGCATKPKVLKGEEAEVQAPAPASAPESVKEESVKEVPLEAKEVGVTEEDGGEKKKVEEKDDDQTAGNELKEIPEGEKAEEHEGKPRSFSNLFQNDGGKESTEADNASLESSKEEESKEVEKPKEESETKQPEVVEETEIPVEKTPVTEFVDAPGLTVTEKTTETALAKETETETETETKTTESTEKKTEASESVEKETEEAVTEPAEKKPEEAK